MNNFTARALTLSFLCLFTAACSSSNFDTPYEEDPLVADTESSSDATEEGAILPDGDTRDTGTLDTGPAADTSAPDTRVNDTGTLADTKPPVDTKPPADTATGDTGASMDTADAPKGTPVEFPLVGDTWNVTSPWKFNKDSQYVLGVRPVNMTGITRVRGDAVFEDTGMKCKMTIYIGISDTLTGEYRAVDIYINPGDSSKHTFDFSFAPIFYGSLRLRYQVATYYPCVGDGGVTLKTATVYVE
jgi:hypothetical protein